MKLAPRLIRKLAWSLYYQETSPLDAMDRIDVLYYLLDKAQSDTLSNEIDDIISRGKKEWREEIDKLDEKAADVEFDTILEMHR